MTTDGLRRTGSPTTVVVLGSTSYDGHQLYDQRLARALARTRRVVFVEPPAPVLNLGRSGPGRRLCRAVDGLLVVRPRMMPFGRRRLLAAPTALGVALQLWWILVTHRLRDVGVVICSAHPVTARLLGGFPRVALVKDDYVAGASLIRASATAVAKRRRALLGMVEGVAVVSPVLAWGAESMGARGTVHVLPPGCDPGLSAAAVPLELDEVPKPRAAFIGMVSDRIDFDVLDEVRQQGVTVVAVGRQQPTFTQRRRWQDLLDSGAVHHLGERDPVEVASVLTQCQFGLVPYTATDFNRASFPLKILEYLAAGIPVVATDLPSVHWLAAPHVHITAGGDVQGAISAALRDSDDPGTARACRVFASGYTWESRANAYLELLAEARSVRRGDPRGSRSFDGRR